MESSLARRHTQVLHTSYCATIGGQHKQTLFTKIKSFFMKTASPVTLAPEKEPAFTLSVAQQTDVGRRRPHNEDTMAHIIPEDAQVMAQKGALFIVADGMGGHAAGEVASELAVNTVCQEYYQHTGNTGDEQPDIARSLIEAVKRANTVIHQRAQENIAHTGMGTTCVAAVLRGATAYIANVGDSRAYLVHQGQVRQITWDHSWVGEQVRAGILTPEQARHHRMRNVITRTLGHTTSVEVDLFTENLSEGDSLVLCSDGLSGSITDDELVRIVEQFVPQESVQHLVEYANAHDGNDNITAVIVRLSRQK